MCLELFNPFLGLPLAWLGLALFAVIVALLAARSLLASSKKGAAQDQNSGFTCPCYAPPVAPPKKETE
jgi:hypothetical protein